MSALTRHWLQQLVRQVSRAATQLGPQSSCLPGVSLLRYESPVPWRRNRWTPSVGLVVQGTKEIEVGTSRRCLPAGSFLASPLDLPVSNRITVATPEKPFLVLNLQLDPLLLQDLGAHVVAPTTPHRPSIGAAAGPELIEAFARLGRQLTERQPSSFLTALRLKEIFFHLLATPEGAALCQFSAPGTPMFSIAAALAHIHQNLPERIVVDSLARNAQMSRSAFFEHFRTATHLSPIQYQKQLRLLEARRLLTLVQETVEGVAHQVGYKSVSQFSREYVRYFGHSPRASNPTPNCTKQGGR